jgi:ABC-2 type transport system permease protein
VIRTVLRVGWLNLARDRVAQGLCFALPIAFFSLFAALFGGTSGGLPRVELLVVDEDRSEVSRRFVAALAADANLAVAHAGEDGTALTRAQARARLGRGEASVALVVQPGFGASLSTGGAAPAVDLVVDSSNPVAPQMVAGLVQRAVMTAVPDLLLARAITLFERAGGALTPGQRRVADQWIALLRAAAPGAKTRPGDTAPAAGATPEVMPGAMIAALPAAGDLVQVRVVDLLVTSPGKSPVNAFYAAGMAVLFLLFSVTGVAGILLEEERNGTLERLLCSNLTMGTLLAGRWLFATILGVVQISVMFLWGALAFDVDLFTPRHLAGFGLMTLATASAAASFGIFLATLCRTRSQLDGVGTITILIMSALGGSMFPRFLMPAWMKQVGLLTFNAWAVDGYQKVFWYEQEPLALWPQLGVLAGVTLLLLLVARRLARRWEST